MVQAHDGAPLTHKSAYGVTNMIRTLIEIEAERPSSQRGATLIAVGVLGPGSARIRVSQQYVERSCESGEFPLVDAHGIKVAS